MVSEWMPNGDIQNYVRKNPEADRIQLVGRIVFFVAFRGFLHRAPQLLDICHGLQVLHTHDIVHGDLKGVRPSHIKPTQPVEILIISRSNKANILINGSGWACLTDFGLSSIASLGCTESSAHGPCGTFQWTAPELLRLTETQPNPPTKESDIYALAMVAIEV
jgi:serine/threonine protein kinase